MRKSDRGLSMNRTNLECALAWKAAFILTGNVRGFRRSPIPALTPEDWIKRFEPALLD